MQHLGGADAFPRRGDLDQDAFARNAVLGVERDEPVRLVEQCLRVKREVRIRLGGDAARHDFQNLQAEQHEQLVHDLVQQRLAARPGLAGVGDGFLNQALVGGHLRGLENQRRIRRGILRRVFLQRGEIPGVGDDAGELLELVELVHNILKAFQLCEHCRKTAAGANRIWAHPRTAPERGLRPGAA